MKPARLVRLGLGLAFATGTGAQESWSPVISPVTQNLWGVARGGGQFVAVGENGTLISSPDGLAWASRTSGLPDTWLVSAAYGDGIWVVVGDRGRLLTSTDLATWYLRASGTAARLNGVAYGGGRWMIVAESGEVLTSTDAAAWTTLRPSSDRLHGIVHAYGQFAITGDNGLVRTTIDATDFAERVLPGGLFLEAVAHHRRAFVAVGEGGFAVTSPDAVTWTALTTGTTAHFRGLTAFNGQLIAAGAAGTIATTPAAGSPWTVRQSGTSALLTGAAASETAAVVVGFGGVILRSAPAAFAPVIVAAPTSIIATAGSNVLFDVTASGFPAPSHQWLFNGQPLAGATGDRLFLTDVQASQAGQYAVRVTNPGGSVTSGAALLEFAASTEPAAIVDAGFAPTLLMPGGPAAAAEQTDGKILLGGSQFSVTAGLAPFALARLHPNGAVDAAFALGSGLNSGGSVADLLVQPDGRILVAGTFQSLNGISRDNLARLNPDGGVDPTFVPRTLPSTDPVSRVALQPDGRLLVLAGTTLRRLNPDGNADATWTSVTGVAAFGLLANGTIAVVRGLGGPERLSAVGSLDASSPLFPATYAYSNYLRTLISSGEGRVYGSGTYRIGIGIDGFAAVELDAGPDPVRFQGVLDVTRSSAFTLAVGRADRLVVGTTARVMIGRQLTTVATVARYRGQNVRDTSFESRAGANGALRALFPLRDGGVLVSGAFTEFDGLPRPNLVRLVAANAVEAHAPVIVAVTPEAAAVVPGTAVTLAVSAAGSGPLAYEWAVRNAAGATLHLDASAATSRLTVPTHISGAFTATVTVRNRVGTTTSAPVRVTVAPSAPILLVPPAPVTAFSGRGAVLSVTAAGTEPFSYQWYRDGILVGTGRTLSFARVSSSAAGDYTVDVTNSLGRTTSAPVRLTVDATARLANLSTRISLGAGRPLIAGFVISGPASQRVLVRGIGPGLAAFGLSGLLPDPVLTVFDSAGRPVAGNDNFDPAPLPREWWRAWAPSR